MPTHKILRHAQGEGQTLTIEEATQAANIASSAVSAALASSDAACDTLPHRTRIEITPPRLSRPSSSPACSGRSRAAQSIGGCLSIGSPGTALLSAGSGGSGMLTGGSGMLTAGSGCWSVSSCSLGSITDSPARTLRRQQRSATLPGIEREDAGREVSDIMSNASEGRSELDGSVRAWSQLDDLFAPLGSDGALTGASNATASSGLQTTEP